MKYKKYSSKIIKAPALIKDAKLFLSQWDDSISIEENVEKAIQYNIMGKSSRIFAKNIIKAFKERYYYTIEFISETAEAYFQKWFVFSSIVNGASKLTVEKGRAFLLFQPS